MVTDASPFVVNLKAELNGLRNTVLGVLDYPAELVPVINRLSFAQCAYLLSVYRLETLRFVFKDSWQCVCVWFLPARNRECAVYFCEHSFREYDILTPVLVKKHLLFYPWIFVNNVHSCVRGSIWTQCESDEFGSIWPVLVPCFLCHKWLAYSSVSVRSRLSVSWPYSRLDCSTSSTPFSSDRQHLSCDDCLEVRGEIIGTVLCCIVYWSCAQS